MNPMQPQQPQQQTPAMSLQQQQQLHQALQNVAMAASNPAALSGTGGILPNMNIPSVSLQPLPPSTPISNNTSFLHQHQQPTPQQPLSQPQQVMNMNASIMNAHPTSTSQTHALPHQRPSEQMIQQIFQVGICASNLVYV
jgi:hypothetical protein